MKCIKLVDISRNQNICIYGAGIAGIRFKRIAEKERPDIKIDCFLDTFKSGDVDGLPVFKLDDIMPSSIELKNVIVSTECWPEILQMLQNYDDFRGKVKVVHHSLWHVNVIPDEAIIKYEKKKNRAIELFDRKEDQTLYEFLFEARMPNSECCELNITNLGSADLGFTDDARVKIEQLSKGDIHDRKYLDYINPAHIKVVLQGGISTATDTAGLVKNIPDLKLYYAFDPSLDAFMSSEVKEYLNSFSGFRIFDQALTDKTENLYFVPASGPNGYVAKKPPLGSENKLIKATTIDSLVETETIKNPDLIVLDIENAELPALKGGRKSFISNRSQFAVSIYHSVEQFVGVPLFLAENLDEYVFRLAHYSNGISQTVLYAIPKEKL